MPRVTSSQSTPDALTDKIAASPALNLVIGTTAAVMTAALTPTFSEIEPQGLHTFQLSQLACRVSTLFAANTFGAAIYSIVYTNSTTWSLSLLCQLNAAGSTAAAGIIKGDVTTGAAGSGAAVVTLDFTANRYVVGSMASEVTTAAFTGHTPSIAMVGYGMLRQTSAARASTTDWPSSYDQTTTTTINASRVNVVHLFTATGKILP